MRRLFLFWCLLSVSAWAQFTTVSGTVTDPNGLAYANGTITATLVISSSPKFTATNQPYTPPTQPVGLSTAGSFVMQLADVTQLTPGGGTYNFTVSCALGCVPVAGGKGPVTFTVTGITISGSSQSITATLNAAALTLSIAAGLPAGPTSPNGVAQTLTSTPSGGVAGPAVYALQGTIPRASTCAGNVDTILVTDRSGYVSENDAAACAVTLPQAGSIGFANNFTFAIKNIGAGTVTITPTTSTIDGAATATLNSGTALFIYSDNSNYFSISPATAFPDLTDTPGSVITSTVPIAWSAGTARSGTNPQWFRCNAGTALCFAQGGDTADVMVSSGNGAIIGASFGFGWTSTAGNAIPGTIDTEFCRLTANLASIGSSNCAANSSVGGLFGNSGFGVSLVSTSLISPVGVPVKADTANANQVVVLATTDTGGGISIGVAIQGCGAAAQCRIITTGVASMILDSGTCSIGQFVIAGTTTAGRVACTSTFTAGTVIGKALAADAVVGTTFNVMVGLR